MKLIVGRWTKRLGAARFGMLLGVALSMLIFLAPSTLYAQQRLKVGYVNLQQALNSVADGRAAKAKLKKDFEKKQKKLNKKQEVVKKLKGDLENSSQMLSVEAKRAKVEEFQRLLMELQQTYMALQQELAKAEAKATKKIFDKMGKIIETIAKDKKYDLILERTQSAVLFAKDNMDLTPELIKRYNASK